VSEGIGEMIAFTKGSVKKFYIDDVVRFLVCDLDNTDHVVSYTCKLVPMHRKL